MRIGEESERFSQFVTGMLRVPHSEIKRKLDEEKKQKARKKRVKALRASRAVVASS